MHTPSLDLPCPEPVPADQAKPGGDCVGRGEACGFILGSRLVVGVAVPRSRSSSRMSQAIVWTAKTLVDLSTHGRKNGVAFRDLCCVRGARLGGVFGDRRCRVGGSLPLARRLACRGASNAFSALSNHELRSHPDLSRGSLGVAGRDRSRQWPSSLWPHDGAPRSPPSSKSGKSGATENGVRRPRKPVAVS